MRHLHLKRKTIIQMIILTVVALIAGAVMIFSFIGLPGMLFGVGQYKVTAASCPRPADSTRGAMSPTVAPKSAGSKTSS